MFATAFVDNLLSLLIVGGIVGAVKLIGHSNIVGYLAAADESLWKKQPDCAAAYPVHHLTHIQLFNSDHRMKDVVT